MSRVRPRGSASRFRSVIRYISLCILREGGRGSSGFMVLFELFAFTFTCWNGNFTSTPPLLKHTVALTAV